MYKKVCCNPKCGKEYMSTSRNQKYCSDECSEVMRGVKTSRAKVRKRKRKLYDANEEINKALPKSYMLAHEVAELYKVPKKCVCEDENCKGNIELNHKDLNLFNNAPWNLEYKCTYHHKLYHNKYGNVNMVDTYNESIDASGFEDDNKKFVKMVSYTKNKIAQAYNKEEL